jgi:hypothetical protein
MGTVGWRRRQPPFEIFRNGLDAFLESRRKRAAPDELPFQAGW